MVLVLQSYNHKMCKGRIHNNGANKRIELV